MYTKRTVKRILISIRCGSHGYSPWCALLCARILPGVPVTSLSHLDFRCRVSWKLLLSSKPFSSPVAWLVLLLFSRLFRILQVQECKTVQGRQVAALEHILTSIPAASQTTSNVWGIDDTTTELIVFTSVWVARLAMLMTTFVCSSHLSSRFFPIFSNRDLRFTDGRRQIQTCAPTLHDPGHGDPGSHPSGWQSWQVRQFAFRLLIVVPHSWS